MTASHKHDLHGGKFYILDQDHEIATLEYTLGPAQTMVLTHTIVKPQSEGQGLGSQLIKASVEYARLQHMKIKPECSFAKKVFAETEAYQDVLA